MKIGTFHRIQTAISNGGHFTQDDEKAWIRNSVNSQALYDHLRDHGGTYDRLIMGPYLFGLIFYASQIHPEKTFLIPCLHDEPFAYLHLMKEMFETVSGFLFNAKPEQDLACRLFHIPKEKCAIVGMGLGPFHVDPSAFANRYQLDKPYVLYSGRREPLKGTPLLIDYMQAFRQRTHQDVKLVFTGSGPIDAPPELEPHILDVGFVPEQEKHEAMAGARAFLHPSVNESFGIVLLESWLAQTPALVHAKSDVLQWQCRRSGAGLWFKNYPEFEQELNLLLNNKGLNKEMGQDGRNYVIKEYAWEHVEQKLLSAFD